MLDITKENLLKDLIKFPKKNIFIILLLLGFGEWFASDVIHLTGGSIGFLILCFGGYFLLKMYALEDIFFLRMTNQNFMSQRT